MLLLDVSCVYLVYAKSYRTAILRGIDGYTLGKFSEKSKYDGCKGVGAAVMCFHT